MTTPHSKKPMRRSPSRLALLLIPLVLVCIGLLPQAQAVVPAPDGGYPGGNTAEGQNALLSLTSGTYNTAVGFLSLLSTTDSQLNTAIGAGALLGNTANENTAIGAAALLSNTTGVKNTANGAFALFSNATGAANTASGYQALFSNQTGAENTAVGYQALYSNIGGTGDNGSYNKAFGSYALWSNTDGWGNNAFGWSALTSNMSGIANNAFADFALYSNTAGTRNIAFGDGALMNNATGNRNHALGVSALYSNVAGEGNTAIGHSAGHSIDGDFNICIGAFVERNSAESNTIRIGDNLPENPGASACFIGGINGQIATEGTAVFIDSTRKLGTVTSSARFKEEIKPIDRASEALFSLKPVSFRYKKEIDPRGRAQFGLVAEEVEKVEADLVVRDKDGKPYSVRYDAVNAMLLNEFLKEHRKNEQQEMTITRMQKQIEALSARLQKVSAELEASNAAPQTVLNSQ